MQLLSGAELDSTRNKTPEYDPDRIRACCSLSNLEESGRVSRRVQRLLTWAARMSKPFFGGASATATLGMSRRLARLVVFMGPFALLLLYKMI